MQAAICGGEHPPMFIQLPEYKSNRIIVKLHYCFFFPVIPLGIKWTLQLTRLLTLTVAALFAQCSCALYAQGGIGALSAVSLIEMEQTKAAAPHHHHK